MKFIIKILEEKSYEVEAVSREEALRQLAGIPSKGFTPVSVAPGQPDPDILPPNRNDLSDINNFVSVSGKKK